MKICFIFPREKPYDSLSVRELPSGGTEKAVIFLGEAFQKLGYEVEWLTTQQELLEAEGSEPDIVITQEAELLQLFPRSRKVWWTHHFSDQPIIQRSAAYGRAFADVIVTLSQCQQDDFKRNMRLDSVKIGHGVWLDEVQRCYKDPYRLIYASTPFRGLELIPDLFRKIKAAEPRATIAICSSMGTYGHPEQDQQYQKLFDELSTIDGVELLGALNQKQLYLQYAKASIFFYPCTWPETYCLAMDEAIAHGCKPLTSNLGALRERGACKIYDSEWVTACEIIFGKLENEYYPYPYFNKEYVPQDWMTIAKQWEREVFTPPAL